MCWKVNLVISVTHLSESTINCAMYNYQFNRHNVGINKLAQIHFTIWCFPSCQNDTIPLSRTRLVLSLSKAFLLLLAWFGRYFSMRLYHWYISWLLCWGLRFLPNDWIDFFWWENEYLEFSRSENAPQSAGWRLLLFVHSRRQRQGPLRTLSDRVVSILWCWRRTFWFRVSSADWSIRHDMWHALLVNVMTERHLCVNFVIWRSFTTSWFDNRIML